MRESFKRDIIGLNEGSWILIEGETETLYGAGYLLKDGLLYEICREHQSIVLRTADSKSETTEESTESKPDADEDHTEKV